ncbi:MAG: cyclic nucleotide-binding domain-containing protein [Pseudomonadota bacterium]|nr:cyclic nucleotide-binding domain-containing protein [Pseudomonadota bacterium]
MIMFDFGPSIFAQGALLFYVIGLFMRDGLKLRLFLLAGTSCYLAYYYTIADQPLWDAIISSSAIGVANLYAIFSILLERTTFTMSHDDKELYAHFPTMTPGQFRRIMRFAHYVDVTRTQKLTYEGHPPQALYFVSHGPMTLEREDRSVALSGGQFIGEVSFIRGHDTPASATVSVSEGARFVSWDRRKLDRELEKSKPIANAFSALFNRDLSAKVTQSWPGAYAPK